ncbi:MAG: hypothetical protein KJ561_04575 [Nanoarchaeota archaeon]|nr:hypothetical protein [Nanoarchaeota archaeon]
MVSIIKEEQLIALDKANKKQFKDTKGYYEFLMFEVQKHIVEINDLKENKNPHVKKEIVDLAILSKMLALNEGANKGTYNERLKKFKEKSKQSFEGFRSEASKPFRNQKISKSLSNKFDKKINS